MTSQRQIYSEFQKFWKNLSKRKVSKVNNYLETTKENESLIWQDGDILELLEPWEKKGGVFDRVSSRAG